MYESEKEEILEQIRSIRVFQRGSRRAPHKPLLLLFALAQLQHGKTRLPYKEVEAALLPMLDTYAPPVKGRHQPELPYWHLASDGLWEIPDADSLERQASGFPAKASLSESFGKLNDNLVAALQNDSKLFDQVVQTILEQHFSPTTHEDIVAHLGLSVGMANFVSESLPGEIVRRKRDQRFREEVLRAYEYRCAFSGFRASLSRTYVGCEAAHVQWHAFNGPDDLSNGLALEPTAHKLFDLGAWTLSDDRRIIVSSHLTGSDVAIARIRERHGMPLHQPLPGTPPIDLNYIQWHREPELGGVFRSPGLPL